MRLISLQRYVCGYLGIWEESAHYVLFRFSRRGGLKRLHRYPRSDYRDHIHFSVVIGKFIPAHDFLYPPRSLPEISMSALSAIEVRGTGR